MLQHLAIIMDGNGRWAKSRNLPRTAGHKRGAETARKIIELCGNSGIKHLTLYTFSAENWNRPQDEVNDLMGLLKFYLGREVKNLHKQGIKLNFIGDRSKLSKDIVTKIIEAEELTKKNENLLLNIALSYGSRQEILEVTKQIASDYKNGKIEEITEQIFENNLYTNISPDPDLLIRTGGEQRISNFLLWQMAYTELYFTDTLWPDFNEECLKQAIEEFDKRERRFGNV